MDIRYRIPNITEFVPGFKYEVLHTFMSHTIDFRGEDKDEHIETEVWVTRTFGKERAAPIVDDSTMSQIIGAEVNEEKVDSSLKHIEEMILIGSIRVKKENEV